MTSLLSLMTMKRTKLHLEDDQLICIHHAWSLYPRFYFKHKKTKTSLAFDKQRVGILSHRGIAISDWQ
jgi:hypothetical protein